MVRTNPDGRSTHANAHKSIHIRTLPEWMFLVAVLLIWENNSVKLFRNAYINKNRSYCT